MTVAIQSRAPSRSLTPPASTAYSRPWENAYAPTGYAGESQDIRRNRASLMVVAGMFVARVFVARVFVARVFMARVFVTGIGAAFRMEGRLRRAGVGAEASEHLHDDVVVADAEGLAEDLRGQVAVAQVPGDAQQLLGRFRTDVDDPLGLRPHPHR